MFVEESEEGLDGPPPFKFLSSYYHKDGNVYSEELFRGKIFKIADKPTALKWDHKKDVQKIGNFQCRKAVLKDDPLHTVVWFAEEYPLSFGPAFAVGLPGIPVMVENDYFVLTVKDVKTMPIPAKQRERMKKMRKNTGVTIANYHAEITPLLIQMSKEKIIH